jgi:hypothetical protein
MFLNILYWLILVLSVLGIVAIPPTNPNSRFYYGGAWLALFIIIGIRAFRIAVN